MMMMIQLVAVVEVLEKATLKETVTVIVVVAAQLEKVVVLLVRVVAL
jgi:hypothetical protein